jgi:hypothetical protein
MNSHRFHEALVQKFNITDETRVLTAIQKNLTMYEISPHPDINEKALTYLLNINRDDECEEMEIHTHLLRFKEEYTAVEDFWENAPSIKRCWVPWGWCETVKTISKNNSIVMFQPNSKPASLHAIKLDYDHFQSQRTQVYGNLMYLGNERRGWDMEWEQIQEEVFNSDSLKPSNGEGA